MSGSSLDRLDELNRLLQRVAQGDGGAFAELYRRTSSKLFGVCMRMLHDRGEAEDVLQEIYTSVWRRAMSFDAARASAITWLLALSRNKAIDRLRQRREQPLLDSKQLHDSAAEEPTPASSAESNQQYQRLQRCLDALGPQQRHSVCEAFFSGSTYSELAARLQVPLGTVKSWIRRSLIQLRSCLEQ